MVKRSLLMLLAVFLAWPCLASAKMQKANVAVDVAAGQHKTVRLRNLPHDAAVKVEVRCTGTVTVLFVSDEQYTDYPKILRPLFQSTVHDRFNFTVTIPANGNYYLVFDNTAGSSAVKLDASVTGASGADTDLLQGDRSPAGKESGNRGLESMGRELTTLFVFRPFTLSLRKCDGRDTANSPDRLVLCLEYGAVPVRYPRSSKSLDGRAFHPVPRSRAHPAFTVGLSVLG